MKNSTNISKREVIIKIWDVILKLIKESDRMNYMGTNLYDTDIHKSFLSKREFLNHYEMVNALTDLQVERLSYKPNGELSDSNMEVLNLKIKNAIDWQEKLASTDSLSEAKAILETAPNINELGFVFDFDKDETLPYSLTKQVGINATLNKETGEIELEQRVLLLLNSNDNPFEYVKVYALADEKRVTHRIFLNDEDQLEIRTVIHKDQNTYDKGILYGLEPISRVYNAETERLTDSTFTLLSVLVNATTVA